MKLLNLILVTFLVVLTFTQDSLIMILIMVVCWVCALMLCIIDLKETNNKL